jgi:exodeoxyribonuclease VII large subunit
VYTKDGTCQLYAEFADATGMGIQALELARLRQRLEAEGLFDVGRKRPLPAFPLVIGVATSPAGAVIHDIRTVLRRRFPFAHLLISPCQVQGDGSPDSVVAAIDLLIADGRAQVVIVARGGGSAEDLAAFNDERIARAAFASPVPIISAIGHESDFCILDDVADLRAPTPTAAAELCTPDVADFALEVIDAKERLARTALTIVRQFRTELQQVAMRVDRSSPAIWLHAQRQAVAGAGARAAAALRNRLGTEAAAHQLRMERLRSIGLRQVDQQRLSVGIESSRLAIWRGVAFRTRLDELSTCQSTIDRTIGGHLYARKADLRVLDAKLLELDPTAVLGRGFSLLTDELGETITSIEQAPAGSRLSAHLNDGTIHADVVETRPQAR